ncbi:9477_t:CDS:2 [Diversispora eburnea]|uniref:9477_t:CDS:1 n=1 Tax=Diversispora eburnea TaxID=1213867 RepID=A0A9N9CGI5_9GLOM|nr:9477_t:CDS:2 [Diversispora eburnea]
MAKNVSESLETIELIMDYENPWIFSASSLRKLFEGWCCKGGGGNRKIIVKRPGPPLFKLSDEHFKVIEDYGVQFDILGSRKNMTYTSPIPINSYHGIALVHITK